MWPKFRSEQYNLPKITNDLNQAIAQKQAKFPIRRVEVKIFTINTGLRSKIEDHLFQGQLPKRLFIGMVTNEEFNGSYASNPFRFRPFRLSKLDVSCDGHNIYGRPFEPNFRDDQYLRSYMSLYQALSSQNQVQNCNISFQDYKSNRKAMNRNWSNQKSNLALKTKAGNK